MRFDPVFCILTESVATRGPSEETSANGLDVIVFTAGIGENSDLLRKKVCEGLTFLGLELDEERNQARSKQTRRIT
ncbi:MAG: hypothetical protein K6T71_08270, partial [Candidatus Bipolaricaulota bacterium]|nr:hypothetical protein [Candidatus Bipolaricaulota bacterium]